MKPYRIKPQPPEETAIVLSVKNAPNFLILACALKRAMFVLPVIMLFYEYKGVTVGDFFLIQGLFFFCTFLFELPSGYLGDIFSRRKVLLIAVALYLLGYGAWLFGSGFRMLLLGELLFGLSMALYSGTAEAYLYDLLKKENRQRQMHRKLGQMETAVSGSTAFAAFTGGLIYTAFGPSSTIVCTMVLFAFAFAVLLFIPEIPEFRRKVERGKSKFKDILDISKTTVRHPEIRWLMIFPACFGTGTLILMWGLQPVMMDKDVPTELFGLVVGFNMLCRTGWSAVAGRLFEKLNLRATLVFLLAVYAAGYACAIGVCELDDPRFFYPLLALMAVAPASQIAVKVVTNTLINHRTASSERSTVLSVGHMMTTLFLGTAMACLKPLFDGAGVQETFMICALLILPVGLSLAKLLRTVPDEE